MSLKVLIIPDKFKGTLTAATAAVAIGEGWAQTRPKDKLEFVPMTDGGDGFGEGLGGLLQAVAQTVVTVDAARRPCQAQWWWAPKRRLAIIESAKIVGHAMLPPGRFHPFDLDTFGLGAALQAAARKGAQGCLIGLGGSATNDAGFGLARSLGWKFLNQTGEDLTRWTQLHSLAQIRRPESTCPVPLVTAAVDVQNVLLGTKGCTQVYGWQKGLRKQDWARAELCLERLATVIEREMGGELASVPGAGAAGGLGFGLSCFLNASLEPGFELFAHHAQLTRRLGGVHLVVTAEGAIDDQTYMGKGTGQIAKWCHDLKIPCLGLAGRILARRRADEWFVQTHALTDLAPMKEAKARPAFWLRQLAAYAARTYASRCHLDAKPNSNLEIRSRRKVTAFL